MTSANLPLSYPQQTTAQILVRMITLADRTDHLLPALDVATFLSQEADPVPAVRA